MGWFMSELKFDDANDPTFLIRHMADGYSFESYGAARGDYFKSSSECVARSTLYEWVKSYKSFRYAKDVGEGKALFHFEKLLRLSCLGLKELVDDKGNKKKLNINYKSVMFALKTRFHELYSERPKIDLTNGKSSLDNVNVDDIKKLMSLVQDELEARNLTLSNEANN